MLIIKKVTKKNLNILYNLAQAYESEFSTITKKLPNSKGLYPLDTKVDKNHPSFLIYKKKTPIGFCIKGIHDGRHDIAEFFIIPTFRSKNIGQKFAYQIFKKYKGEWQVRQINGADKARKFWRKTIKSFTHNQYTESLVKDPYWGTVSRQIFRSS